MISLLSNICFNILILIIDKKKKYSKEQLEIAAMAVIMGDAKMSDMARKYNIPVSTLSDKIKRDSKKLKE